MSRNYWVKSRVAMPQIEKFWGRLWGIRINQAWNNGTWESDYHAGEWRLPFFTTNPTPPAGGWRWRKICVTSSRTAGTWPRSRTRCDKGGAGVGFKINLQVQGDSYTRSHSSSVFRKHRWWRPDLIAGRKLTSFSSPPAAKISSLMWRLCRRH